MLSSLSCDEEIDEYGYIPMEFHAITDYPIGYWSKSITHNDIVYIPEIKEYEIQTTEDLPIGFSRVCGDEDDETEYVFTVLINSKSYKFLTTRSILIEKLGTGSWIRTEDGYILFPYKTGN